MSKSNKLKRARVLNDFVLDGMQYKSNEIIESSARLIASLSGAVDSHKDAVDYCINELKAQVKTHPSNDGAAGDDDEGAGQAPDPDENTQQPGTDDTQQQTNLAG